jgi:hypothetical protein
MDNEVEIADAIQTAVAAAMEAPEAVLTAMYKAMLTYHETKDPAILIEFAEAARLTAMVHYAKRLKNAPLPALGGGRSLDEIFARQPT